MGDQPGLPEGRDVEDVLSSIRKLVSAETEARLTESQRAFSRRMVKRAGPTDALRPNGDVKPLLLSTSQRVRDTPSRPVAAEQDAAQDAIDAADSVDAVPLAAHAAPEAGPPDETPVATASEAAMDGPAPDAAAAPAQAEPLRLVVPDGAPAPGDGPPEDQGDGPEALPTAEPADHVAAAPAPPAGRLTLGVPEPAPGEEAEADVRSAPPSDEDLAEIALRELVRSVIREELEGEIGDRISRNITQFVRKEIAKAIQIDPTEV